MRALRALPLLLCAAMLAEVSAEVKAVKLCGREFLRAVVYTCGGSRWRRLLTDEGDGMPTGEQSGVEGVAGGVEGVAGGNPGFQLSRRDINNMLANVCCKVGCRKSELTFLC